MTGMGPGPRGETDAVDVGSIAAGLQRGENGIWYAARSSPVSYPAEGHQSCFEIEETSFWFAHRNRCIIALLAQYPPGGPLFEVGGGNGFVSRALADRGLPVVLVEPAEAGARNARNRGLDHVICSSLEDAGFAEGSLPAVGLFDVVEHLRDDASFLRSLRPLMRPGGRVYLTVPAYSSLWSNEDEQAGHYRRYRAGGVEQRLEAAGFTPEFATYIFRFLPIPIFFFRTLPSKLGRNAAGLRRMKRDHSAKNAASRILRFFLDPEIRNIERKRPMRFGGSILVVARA